jgi:hypothetical protein
MIAIDPQKRFDAKLKVWGKVGEIMESYRLGASGRQQAGSSAEIPSDFAVQVGNPPALKSPKPSLSARPRVPRHFD